MHIETSSLQEITVIDGFHARFIHTDSLTLGYWKVDKGSKLPPTQSCTRTDNPSRKRRVRNDHKWRDPGLFQGQGGRYSIRSHT